MVDRLFTDGTLAREDQTKYAQDICDVVDFYGKLL